MEGLMKLFGGGGGLLNALGGLFGGQAAEPQDQAPPNPQMHAEHKAALELANRANGTALATPQLTPAQARAKTIAGIIGDLIKNLMPLKAAADAAVQDPNNDLSSLIKTLKDLTGRFSTEAALTAVTDGATAQTITNWMASEMQKQQAQPVVQQLPASQTPPPNMVNGQAVEDSAKQQQALQELALVLEQFNKLPGSQQSQQVAPAANQAAPAAVPNQTVVMPAAPQLAIAQSAPQLTLVS